MNWLINLIGKWSGVGKVWDALDGWKTKLAAGASILSGISGLILKALPLIDKHDLAAVLEFAKSVPQDQSWLLIVGGFAALGLGHKIEKAKNDPVEPTKP